MTREEAIVSLNLLWDNIYPFHPEEALGMAIAALKEQDVPDTNVVKTNADHIRSMTDEELSVFLHTSFSCYGCPARIVCASADLDCDDIVFEWLKQPYKEDT